MVGGDSRVYGDRAVAGAGTRSSAVAWLGICLLILVAPFEALDPIVEFPGQSLSSVEVALLVVIASWLLAATALRDAPVWRTPLTWPWIAFLGAMLVAAVAGFDRSNALHMVGRFALAFGVYLMTVNGVNGVGRLRGLIAVASIAGAIVAALAALEYLGVEAVLQALTLFRPRVSVIGTQVRAGGPFQYPTIASMYLEIVFALSLGLLLVAIDADREKPARARRIAIGVLVGAILLISEAVTLTFTRSGLITMAGSLALLAVLRVWLSGLDRGTKWLMAISALIALQILTSRSFESLRLRLTTEGQETWYRAAISAPSRVTLQAGAIATVPVTLTNSGLSTWDSHAVVPFRVSYHWLQADADSIVHWEGLRTEFPARVAPGETVTMKADVEAPPEPGDYRLMWDIEQEKRLWFSSEPGADLSVSLATIRGPAVAARVPEPIRPVPRPGGRPGRGVLWRAATSMAADHPLLGVGPDNYRLLYGGYAGIANFDSRVHSNNMYLEVLTGGGLAGGLAFAWLCWRAARRAVHPVLRPSDPAVASLAAAVCAAAVAIALHGLVDSFLGFTGTYIPIAIVLGLAVAGDALNRHLPRP